MNPNSKHREYLRKKILSEKEKKTENKDVNKVKQLKLQKHEKEEYEDFEEYEEYEEYEDFEESEESEGEKESEDKESEESEESEDEEQKEIKKVLEEIRIKKDKDKEIQVTSKETKDDIMYNLEGVSSTQHRYVPSEEVELLKYEEKIPTPGYSYASWLYENDDNDGYKTDIIPTTPSLDPMLLTRYPILYNSHETNLNNSINKGDRVYLCPFRIVRNNHYPAPYLEYYLYKYPKSKDKKINDLMIFTYIKFSGKTNSTPLKECNKRVNELFSNKLKKSTTILNQSGIIKYNNIFYVFYDTTGKFDNDKSLQNYEQKRDSQWWWCIIDEIVNKKKVLNFPIFQEHINLFLFNPSIIYLYHPYYIQQSQDNNTVPTPYDIPTTGYHGTYYNLKNMILTQGIRPSTINSMVGPYYYFGSFRKAVRYAGWTSTYSKREIDGVAISDDNGRYKRGAIIRFAVFIGDMKALLNHPNDRDDYSDIVKERIRLNPKSRKREMMTIKLHDHDAKWSEKYDSVYIGKAILSNGKTFMSNYEFVVKDNYSIITLTSHELDQSTLEENWNNSKEDYNIL